MNSSLFRLCKLPFCIIGSFLATSKIAIAQVTPDASSINTQVNQNGSTAEIIGGQAQGSNLFHSFDDFSVPTNNEAFFNNADNISNIFSRVTGGNISNIDGAIRANGSANLFLINPAGIIFGENARLDLGGSFLATTSSSILFEDGQFSATDLTDSPLLTINAPIGLDFRDNAGAIINRSMASNNPGEPVGLEVAPGRNLALIGGNINLEAGKVTARGGNIQLGGLSEAGTVNINLDSSFSFPESVAKADINLNNAAEISVVGTREGSIDVNARNLNLAAGELGRSSITKAVATDTAAESQSGNITLDVAKNITIDNSNITNIVLPQALENTGTIAIATSNLVLTNGGTINASTVGQGNAGLVDITARDTITIDGENSSGLYSGILSAVATGASGDSGGITISTSNLILTDGAEINASTAGQGNAGMIDITARDTITVDGERSSQTVSSILSAVATEASGDSRGITISTSNLILTDGGTVNASTVGQGNAGLVDITASNNIRIDGENPSGDSSAILSASVSEASGDSEGINITTSDLALTNDGVISVSALARGNAGRLSVRADSLSLNNNSSIRALTQFGLGGTIDLQIAENIILNNNSQITARAFGEADGGNLTIDTNFIIAFPNGNNDIIANSQQGNGGNITINVQSLFGIEERSLNDLSNDINAGSQFSLDGNVLVDTTDLGLIQGMTELVENIIPPSEQTTAEACSTGSSIANNRFIISGKGGIPPLPNSFLDSHNIILDNDEADSAINSKSVETSQEKIKPARGVKRTALGGVILTAHSTNNLDRIPKVKANCGV